jgi:mRNA-degrading endonuclease RelE of RelBE toxin-antitoxin system
MYKIAITKHFKKPLKRLVKKDSKLKERLMKALRAFEKRKSIAIGKNVYKIRLQANSRGKSAGYRLYILVVEIDNILAPVHIYHKGEKENLPLSELTGHIEQVNQELNSQ